jgi:hypothetical protein
MFNLNNLSFILKFSASSILRATIDKASPTFELFELSLAKFPNLIEKLNSLINEYNDIIAKNGGITIELL